AEAARGQACEHAPGGGGDRRQVGVDPRHDAADEVVLPDAGPLARVVAVVRTGGWADGDERTRAPGGDERVRALGQVERVHVARRAARHAVQEVRDRVAPGGRVAGREVDEGGTAARAGALAGDGALPDGAAGGS